MAAAKRIFVFDMDGTLTAARQKVKPEMESFLAEVRANGTPLALVGGSNLVKILEQMNGTQAEVCSRFDYLFSEQGIVGFKGNVQYPTQSIEKFLGKARIQEFVNWCLHYIADLDLPAKTGTFIESRLSMLNVSPVGRQCSQNDRVTFVKFDQETSLRKTMVEKLQQRFPVDEWSLQFSLGGQISVDVFPVGWDKSYCLQYLVADGFTHIHFFGDRTDPGGNDHEIYADARTIGHKVTSPEDTMQQVKALLS